MDDKNTTGNKNDYIKQIFIFFTYKNFCINIVNNIL